MARTARSLKTLLGSALLLATIAPSTGCWWLLGGGYEGATIESEDVELELGEGFRAEGDQGDLHWLCNETATNTNSWVTSVVEVQGIVVEFLNNYRESSLDGAWRVYGPFDDNSSERDLAWIVRISGDESDTAFEFLVAPKGSTDESDFSLLTEGNLMIEDDLRSGSIHIDFDTLEQHNDSLDLTLLWSYAGDITIDFERDVSTGEKTITLDYDAFTAVRTGYLDDDVFSSDETYEFHKAADGSGSFHIALMGEWDTWPWTWSGPLQERMQLDMVWTADQSGRAYGTITEVAGEGDMKHGDLALDECFGADGGLSYRYLSEAYAAEVPGYNFGEADSCVVELP